MQFISAEIDHTISGYRIVDRELFEHWAQVFEEWLLLYERYSRICSEDPAYWYSERPNISLLAGAAWRAGWLALEEFAVSKKNSERGRGDLQLISPHGQYSIVEAKFALRHTAEKKATEQCISKAVRDAMQHSKRNWDKRVGLYVMCLKLETDLVEAPKINEIVNAGLEVESDWFLWSFPGATRNLKGSEPNITSFRYPGVCCFGKAG